LDSKRIKEEATLKKTASELGSAESLPKRLRTLNSGPARSRHAPRINFLDALPD
jgi:hypothetical protein